jgi:hypothetical protein
MGEAMEGVRGKLSQGHASGQRLYPATRVRNATQILKISCGKRGIFPQVGFVFFYFPHRHLDGAQGKGVS